MKEKLSYFDAMRKTIDADNDLGVVLTTMKSHDILDQLKAQLHSPDLVGATLAMSYVSLVIAMEKGGDSNKQAMLDFSAWLYDHIKECFDKAREEHKKRKAAKA